VPARPLVTVHFAQSLDGRIGFERGPALLSSDEGIERAHRTRTEHDAVIVGAETVRTDDPRLTVRACAGRNPIRVVLASSLDLPRTARLFDRDQPGGPVIVVGAAGRASRQAQAWLGERGAETVIVPADADGRVSLPDALAALGSRGVTRVLVEGGARVLTSFLKARLVDRAEVEIAPRFLGAPSLPAFGALGVTTMRAAFALEGQSVETLGQNLFVRGDVVYPE
jgi:riboflavin-specific deaminase-like protein